MRWVYIPFYLKQVLKHIAHQILMSNLLFEDFQAALLLILPEINDLIFYNMSEKLVAKCQANLKERMSFARIDSTMLYAKSANFIVIICNGHRLPPSLSLSTLY